MAQIGPPYVSSFSYSMIAVTLEKFICIDLNHFDEAQCLTEFHITKNDIYQLANVLQMPMKIMCCQRTISSNIVGICILLKRLAYPCQFTDMVPIFGRNQWKYVLYLIMY